MERNLQIKVNYNKANYMEMYMEEDSFELYETTWFQRLYIYI
jgi:hypothetical protein